MMSLNDDNSVMGIFNEEEINNFDIDNKKWNHKFYFNDQVQTFNQNTHKINTLMQGIKERNEQNQLNMLVKAPDTNTNIFTEEEEEKDIDNIINEKNKIIIKRYRRQFKDDKDKDILRIEKSVGDSGCCASCT